MLIRPLARSDFAAILAWFPTEAALIQWGGPAVVFPLDEAQLDRMLDDGRKTPPLCQLWVGERDGVVVAHAQVALDWRHGVARLQRVGVDPHLRGQGLSVPFLRRVIDLTFAEPSFERLELNVYSFNAPAIKAYRALGFVEEGTRRSSVRVGSERWDTVIFGLLRADLAKTGAHPPP
jgi:RimJ/RimL family protein N-acetyltransferase